MDAPYPGVIVQRIRNAGWWVRHYGTRPAQRLLRDQAILKLGLVVREAMNSTDDFEPILRALIDALFPQDIPPF